MPLENFQIVATGDIKPIAAVDPCAAGGHPAIRWPANLIVDIVMRLALYLKTTGMPISGQTSRMVRPSTASNKMLAGMPAAKNSPLVNCLEL